MTPTPEVQQRLRRYLLGQLADDDREEFEKGLLASDEVYQELLITEDELIDEYLGGRLGSSDRASFEQYFLVAPERRQKLKFSRALTRHLSSQAGVKLETAVTDRARSPVLSASPWYLPRALFSSPLGIAVSAILVIGIAIGSWRIFYHQSEVDKGLVALNSAYRTQRPLQSRISSLSYAPFEQTRGGVDRVDSLALSRADAILSNAVLERPNAQTHHAIGEVYLSKKQFDLALKEFDEALKTDSTNAMIYSDLGATLMEQADASGQAGTEGKRLEALGLALERFDSALQLNPATKEALYNRALCLQRMKAFTEAKKAWEQYLKIDPTSAWADEARAALKTIGAINPSTLSSAQILSMFLAAYEGHDDNRAWAVLSQTREVVTGRMIVFQLINEYLKSNLSKDDQTAARMMAALDYAGKLELERSGDPYVAHLGTYYSQLTSAQREELATAQQLFNLGLATYSKSKYEAALGYFRQARTRFHRAHDIDQENLVSYWIANCETQNDHLKLSVDELLALVKFSEAHNFEWLKGQALWLLASDRFQLGEYSNSIEVDKDAVAAAEKTADGYNRQKIFTQLANKYRQVRRSELALSYHWRSLDLVGSEFGSARQAWRTYVSVAETFFSLGNLAAATAYQKEALRLAEETIQDAGLLHASYVQLAQIYRASKLYGLAREAIGQSLKQAQTIGDDQVSHKLVAYSTLQLGHVSRDEGNIGAAIGEYDQAVQYYAPMEFQLDLYEAHKGLLIGYLATGNDAAIERELQTVLDLFETHRNRIIDEQNRNSFFDAEQSVYDLAIGYELSRGRDELAFDYSETSRARSLLDSLHYAPQRAAGNEIADLPFRSMTTAQGFAQLREQLPAGIQIVQYALLENSLAIWVLSRDGLSVVQRPIARNEFAERVNLYERLITSRHADDADKLRDTASSLYEILIDPIVGKLNQGQPICVIPDKLLFQLSFGSLWSKEAGKYFIEQFPIFISSSLNVLVQCSKAAAAHPATNDEALLGIGNPSFDRAAHPDLSDLPDAVREVSAIAAVYPRTISLTSGAATKNAVEKYLYASDIVHFAGHYFIDSSDSLRSGLLLAPEPARSGGDEALTAQDVFALKLTRPKLIVLSACETTGEKYYGGEGIVGMATTFLAAGVPLVVASQWPVDSNATADLMIAFHNYRRNGYSTISALRQAQIDMIRGSKNADRPPYSWAAFIPIGGFATF